MIELIHNFIDNAVRDSRHIRIDYGIVLIEQHILAGNIFAHDRLRSDHLVERIQGTVGK